MAQAASTAQGNLPGTTLGLPAGSAGVSTVSPGNGNGTEGLILPDNTEKPARRAGEGRKYFSFSQYTKYVMLCGEMYRRYYIEGEPEPKGSNLALGSACHKAIEHDYREKIKTGVNVPVSVKEDVFVQSFRNEVAQGIVFEEFENQGDIEKTGLSLVRIHHEKVAIHTHPVAVEKKIEIDVPGMDVPIIGYLDLIERDQATGNLVLRDHKTSAKRYAEDSAGTSIQLGLYALDTGIDDVSFDVLIKSRIPDIQRVPGKMTALFKSYCASQLRDAYLAIKAGIFLKAIPGRWPCQPGRCHYWANCAGKYCGK